MSKLNNIIDFIENKKKSIEILEDDPEWFKQEMSGYKKALKDVSKILNLLNSDNNDINKRSVIFVGIISLIKKELINFFKIRFLNENNLSSSIRNFTDEDLENLIERIYYIVQKDSDE